MTKEEFKKKLLLQIHSQKASEINSLQTALFSTITIITASLIIGILLNIKDLSDVLCQIRTYPWFFIIIVGAIYLLIITAVSYITVEIISKMINKMDKEKILTGEVLSEGSENFASKWRFVYCCTWLYHPKLLFYPQDSESSLCKRFLSWLLFNFKDSKLYLCNKRYGILFIITILIGYILLVLIQPLLLTKCLWIFSSWITYLLLPFLIVVYLYLVRRLLFPGKCLEMTEPLIDYLTGKITETKKDGN